MLAHITPKMITWAIQQQTAPVDDVVTALSLTMGVSPDVIRQWQKDQGTPTMDQAHRLADLLNVPFGYLWLTELPESFDPHWKEWRDIRKKSSDVVARQLDTGEWLVRDLAGDEFICGDVYFNDVFEFVEESNN